MPGSLLGLSSRVRRSESGRSDRSDISAYSADSKNSGKKVSFNKAVRVKKYPRRADSSLGDDGLPSDLSPEKRFWFKVYRNRHPKKTDGLGTHDSLLSDHSDREENGYGRLDTIEETDGPRSLPNLKYTSEVGVGTYDDDLFVRAKPIKRPDPIPVRPNHVKKIVNKFNDEAVVKFQRDEESEDDDIVTYTPTKHANGIRQPPEPPVDYADSHRDDRNLKVKRNPLVNGVKVIFGMAQLKKRDDKLKNNVQAKNMANLKKSQGTSTRDRPLTNGHGPYKTSIILADKDRKGKVSTLSRRSRSTTTDSELNNNNVDNRLDVIDSRPISSKYNPLEIWHSGDKLVSDSNRFESSMDKIADGQLYRSAGEQSRIWRNEKRTVYEEELPSMSYLERRAKSYGDLRANENMERRKAIGNGKVLSNDELYHSSDKYGKNLIRDRTINRNISSKSKGIQCNRIEEKEEDKYRIFKSKDGYVSAFSDVPNLDKQRSKVPSTIASSTVKSNGTMGSSEVIYSQVDKSKKKKKFGSSVTTTSTPRTESPSSKMSRGQQSESIISKDSPKVKSSQKSFGFRLKKAFGGDKDKSNTYTSAYGDEDDNWYDVEADVAAAEKRGKKNGQLESRDEELSSVSDAESDKRKAVPASVIREIDPKKKEISYENVPHPISGNSRDSVSAGGGMWFRNADEDYRREMAQSDVSYPSGTHVGNNEVGSSATLSRVNDKRTVHREDGVPVKSYTLDRRHANNNNNNITNNYSKKALEKVKILVNGHEIDDTDAMNGNNTLRRRRSQRGSSADDGQLPSSVQSDPVYHRGGLAAAYKARQKAALKRSSSTAGSSVFGSHLSVNSPFRGRRNHHNSSGGSLVSSSDSDSNRRRRTLVMYIPGVSHPEHRASDDEKLTTLSRTQSMHSSAKPTRYLKNPKSSSNSHSRLAGKSTSDLSANSEEADTITPLRSEMNKKKPRSPGNSLGRGSRKDLRRRHSMPKDTKFGWFKWKIKGKPSKEA